MGTESKSLPRDIYKLKLREGEMQESFAKTAWVKEDSWGSLNSTQ